MTNIILIAKDRPRLTEQCLRTLYMHTNVAHFNLCIVDDGSNAETTRIIQTYGQQKNCEVVHMLKSVGIVGFLRNVGVWTSERVFGRGDWLCTVDNDIAFLRGWHERLIEAKLNFSGGIGVLGGYRHPFHAVNELRHDCELTDAVAGYMQFMNWHTWDTHGPYDQHAKGICQSEDFAICKKITDAGGVVGYVRPAVITMCGFTNTEKRPAIGSEQFPVVRGLICE